MKITRLLPALVCSTLLFSACGKTSDNEDNNVTNNVNNNNGEKKSPLNCDEVNRSQNAPVLAAGTGDVNLSGTYRVDGRMIYNQNQKITVEPGTVFLMDAGSSLLIGWGNDPARINARGTAEKPILFCGTSKASGHWKNIQLVTGTVSGSSLEHVRIEDAGREENALLIDADVDLKSVSVYGSDSVGIKLYSLGKGSENITVKGSKLHPLDLYKSSAVTNLPDGDYTENGLDVAMFHGGGETITFHDRGIPYRQTSERVAFGSTGASLEIIFDAGVEYQFCAGCFMNVGWRSDPATIKSNGTAEKPVIFTSASTDPKPGDWNGVNIQDGILEGSVINYTEFHYGGKAGSANLNIETEKNIPVTNSKFLNSAGYGVKLQSDKTPFDPATNTFEGNAQGDTNLP